MRGNTASWKSDLAVGWFQLTFLVWKKINLMDIDIFFLPNQTFNGPIIPEKPVKNSFYFIPTQTAVHNADRESSKTKCHKKTLSSLFKKLEKRRLCFGAFPSKNG